MQRWSDPRRPRVTLSLCVVVMLLAIRGGLLPGAVAGTAEQGGGKSPLIGTLEGPDVVTDPAQFPKAFNEAPPLAELVKAGKLPPVAERIGQDPLVIKPVHEIGKYGGTWRRGFTGPADWSAGVRVAGTDRIVGWDYTGNVLVPNIAKGWEISDDGRVITFHLRHGMRWSDGHPFTADDFVFWFQEMYQNKDLTPSPTPYMATKGGPGVLEKVDASTIKFTFPDPYYAFPLVLAGVSPIGGQAHEGLNARGGYAPAHYLKRFHPKYVSSEELDRKVKEAKFDNWVNLFKAKSAWALNPELPVVSAWKTTVPNNTPTWVLERNPYSIWVDTAGNQLPYIDRIVLTLGENLEVINLRAIAGEYDLQERHLDLAKVPVFLENQKRGAYRLSLDPEGIGTDVALIVNQSYDADPEIAKWLTNTDFRRALSLGIDRDQLNETFWLGIGVPGSAVVAETSRYNPGPEYRTLWSTYDPPKANAMLDQIGLAQKDGEGYRLRTDGGGRLRIEIQTFVGFFQFTQICEMIREQWRKIGIQADVKEHERSLAYRRRDGNEHQIHVDVHWGTENMFSHSMGTLFPFDGTSAAGPLYGRWYASRGAAGKEPPARIHEVMAAYREAFSVPERERIELGRKVWRIAVEEQWTIGTVGISPAVMGVRVAKANLGNIPARQFNGSTTLSPAQSRPETFFFRE